MSEIPDVVGGEPIEIGWGNPIRDRTVQRYVDATERDTLVPVPIVGDLSFLTASGNFDIYDGSDWRRYYANNQDPYFTDLTIRGWIEMLGHRIRGAGTIEAAPGTTLQLDDGAGIRRVHILEDEPLVFYGPAGGQMITVSDTRVQLHDRTKIYGSLEVADIVGPSDANVTIRVRDVGSLTFGNQGGDNWLFLEAGNIAVTQPVDIRSAPVDQGVARNIFAGTTPPDAGLGDVGDVYLQVGSI